MKRSVALLSLIVTAMLVFVAVQAARMPRRAVHAEPSRDSAYVANAAASAQSRTDSATAQGESGEASVRTSSMPAPRRDFAEIQRRMADGEAGTYIREILLQRDDNIARWPERDFEPLRIWIQPSSALPDFHASYPVRAREAFERWMHVGIPVRYTFVVDSASSDIPVTWVDHFDIPISGRTRWTRDQYWWIVGSSIEVALHHQSGTPLNAEAIYAITLHEVGHVLGLDHTQDERSIMAAKVRVSEMSDVDERTVQLIYRLPPGSVSKP
jgi:hypothetical protein